MNPQKTQEVLAFVEEEWLQFFPQNLYEYFFLALFIAGLGLFGLSSYTTIQRTREIGLRKVLGSSAGNAVLLLLRYFVIQVAIAVPIGWWFFIIPSLIVLIIYMITVISQVWKTANVNPAFSMKRD